MPETTTKMMLVAVASNQRFVTVDVTLEREGQEAWFTVSCP